MTVRFARLGTAEFGDKNVRAIVVDSARATQGFRVAAGMVTVLHAKPDREREPSRGHFCRYRRPGYVPAWDLHRTVPVRFHLRTFSVATHPPVDQIWVRIESLRAMAGAVPFILNNSPTEIELLSLRDGAVALVGHNLLPAGHYTSFDIVLGTAHRVVDGNGNHPLQIVGQSGSILRLDGPFDLRGGRVMEMFLEMDPNTTVFYTSGGYVLDPSVRVANALSMTPEQESRLTGMLGRHANRIADQADFAFEGTVTNVTAVDAAKGPGRAIFSDVTLRFDDGLRGFPDPPPTVDLRVIGGDLNGQRLRVHGMPEFKAGERVLLFLKDYEGRKGFVEGEMGKVCLAGC